MASSPLESALVFAAAALVLPPSSTPERRKVWLEALAGLRPHLEPVPKRKGGLPHDSPLWPVLSHVIDILDGDREERDLAEWRLRVALAQVFETRAASLVDRVKGGA